MRLFPLNRIVGTTAILLLFSSTSNAATHTHAANPAAAVSAMAAARFLQQAGFGPTAASIAQVQALGMGPWIDAQMALDQTKWSTIPEYSTDAKGNTSLTPTQQGFFVNAVNGQDQLRQRVAFAYSQIWVVSQAKLQAPAMVPYLKLLQADAFSTYDKLLTDITLSPAMGHYLDMVNNNKGVSPNENYAREVLQLFSVGLNKLDTFGRPIKDSTGAPIPAYTQDQIEAFSRVFTGWTYAPLPGATSRFGNPVNWNAPLVAFEANHDMTSKTLLDGYTMPANQTAEVDMKDALNNIFQDPNVGPFICRQLIQRLVTSSPSDAYVKRVADVFSNGKPRGDMRAVIKAILLDTEARTGDDNVTENQATKLREPILWLIAFLRGMGATVAPVNNLTGAAAVLGQNLYTSPTVFNYYHPGYEITLSPTLQYNAPEFELLSEATAASAADLVNALVYGTVTGVTLDLTDDTTQAILFGVDSYVRQTLNAALMHGAMPKQMQDTILQACVAQSTPKGIVQAAIYLTASSLNFQVGR